jgi:hypothetical protein
MNFTHDIAEQYVGCEEGWRRDGYVTSGEVDTLSYVMTLQFHKNGVTYVVVTWQMKAINYVLRIHKTPFSIKVIALIRMLMSYMLFS